jgi:nucleoside-diphosphate-sugar epimerase
MESDARVPQLFCFGLGYSARVIARKLVEQGWRVAATTRDPKKADALRGDGIAPYLFNDQQGLSNPAEVMPGVTHLLSSIPPDAQGDPAIHRHGRALTEVFKGSALRWVGYLSTIGVYGDHQGRWIDEDCPVTPLSRESQRRVLAEEQWLEFGRSVDAPAHLFRLPGIYGPGGRSQIDALRAGRARRIVKPGQVFNRIHVDDLADVVIASMKRPGGSSVFNVTDDEPAPANEVVAYAARLLGMDPPPEVAFEDADLPPFAVHFYAECKRVRNDRIKKELGVKLSYPTYREGLAATLASPE